MATFFAPLAGCGKILLKLLSPLLVHFDLSPRYAVRLWSRFLQQRAKALGLVLPSRVLHLKFYYPRELGVALQLTDFFVLGIHLQMELLSFLAHDWQHVALLSQLFDDVHVDARARLFCQRQLPQQAFSPLQIALEDSEAGARL